MPTPETELRGKWCNGTKARLPHRAMRNIRVFSTRAVPEAGQGKGDRKLIGWIDIVAQNAARPPEAPRKRH